MKHPHDVEANNIPSPVSDEDLAEAGIRVGEKGFYDPEGGPKAPKTPRPEPTYGPLLATDPGQPDNIEAKGIHRSSAIDKSRPVPVDSESKPSGRKNAPAKTNS
jgi:hypothetical protein